MSFEAELAFEGLVDRLDPLPYPAKGAVAVGLVLAVRAQQAQCHRLGERRELLAGETFVRQQDRGTVDVPDSAAFTVETKQHLGHSETDQFTVSKHRSAPTTDTRWDHVVIDEHVECR